MKESKTLEFKQDITNTFLKTVCAYANYGTGKILFGVSDDGHFIGIDEPERLCLDIENKINDSINPCPDYTLSIDNKNVITLNVMEGIYKPYFYKSKAYRRNDSATVEVDRLELTRLILEGQNKSFECLKAKSQNLKFSILEKKLKNALGIKELSIDILKTLELYKEPDGYIVAGELLADENTFTGIDIVRFGDDIDIIMDREIYEKISLLQQYEKVLDVYRRYYQYEEIKGSLRRLVEIIPEKAFREAIANALVHRLWDINTHIRVLMYKDKIEIISPGGLPKGVSEKEYLDGQLSILRNPIVGNVFFRLDIIERFGTGVRRIKDSYRNSDSKVKFEVFENSIKITLPIIRNHTTLKEDESVVYRAIVGKEVSSSRICEITGFGKSKVLAIIKRLIDLGYVKSVGNGRGTKYSSSRL